MTAFSFGLGPSDWLKMKNPTNPTQPITQMGTMSNFGTTSGQTQPKTSPLPSPESLYANKTPTPISSGSSATTSNPMAVDPAFQVKAPTTQPINYEAEAAAGAARAAQTGSTAATTAGQTQQQAQGATMATAANTAQPSGYTYNGVTYATESDRNQAAAAAGAGKAANAASTAASQVGQQQQQAQGTAMATAANTAAAQPVNTGVDPISGLPIKPAGTPIETMRVKEQPLATGTETVTAPATPVTAPPKTEPSLDDNMAAYEKIAMDWANGIVDDKVFRTTANRAILQMGLNNQAETDALQMRINQDPALKGQGAGAALLSIMAANQNFSADQMFGQLAQSAQEKILDMQKYGLQQGIAVNQLRRDNDYRRLGLLQDAGDFSGAAALAAKIADFPGVSISPSNFTASRARTSEDAQNLINAGNYEGAAAKLSQLTGTKVDAATLQMRDPFVWKQAQMLEDKGDFEGASKMYAANGLNISADDLRAQSPFQQTSWTNTLDGIKALATTNPAAATAQLDLLMKNPAAAKYLGFTAGMTAQDLIQSIVTGKYQAEQQMRAGLQSEINLKAKSQVGFSQALADYKAMGTVAWQGFTQDGKKMASGDLEAFNAARSALGMSPVHKDAQGNIVDAQGNMLMDDDFAESAAAADYTSRKEKMTTQPWQSAYENLMAPGSPMREKILSIPGGEAAVKESLQMLYLGGGYKLDPASQTMVPDYTGGMPWDNPSTAHIFHNWPLATFAADGTIEGKYDLGGEVYGDQVGDTRIQKMPDDEALEDAYSKYRYNKGTLSAAEWYFATAGGTRPEDKTKIPADLKKSDMTNPGTTPETPGTEPLNPDGTPKGAEGSVKAAQETANTIINSTAGGTPEARAALTENVNTMATAYATKPATGVFKLTIGRGADFDAAYRRLKANGYTDLYNIIRAEDDNVRKTYYGSKDFVNYSIFVKMLDSGMNDKDARAALTSLLGQPAADSALLFDLPQDQYRTAMVTRDLEAAQAAFRAK